MSMHRSLISSNRLIRQRNVLNRWERLEELSRDGQWEEGSTVFGLPKVKVQKVKKRGKSAKKQKEAEESGEATAT